MSDLKTYEAINSRQASVLEVGGFRPTLLPSASHFGLRPLALPSEGWPCNASGEPLQFICQLNLTQAPFAPEVLADIALITFFVDTPSRFIALDSPEDSWCIRAYASTEGLKPLELPVFKLSKGDLWLGSKGFECQWLEVTDHPKYDDSDIIVLEGFDDDHVHLENQHRSKIGGYASSIQHDVYWGHFEMNSDGVLENALQGKVQFALQIDSEAKVGLHWVDSGTVYIGRGISEDTRGQWFVTCQFY